MSCVSHFGMCWQAVLVLIVSGVGVRLMARRPGA